MSISTTHSFVGDDALRRACRRKLQALGVRERQAEQMAADEFAAVRRRPIRQVSARDQRVFPHARGWLVTRSFEAAGARLFRNRMDAERHAKRMARDRAGSGILFYDENGCATLYLGFPDWRQKSPLR